MNPRQLPPFSKKHRIALALIVLVYVVLGVTYALATPPLEASDEYKHYPVVQYIQTQGALPVLDPDQPGRWLQEATQPPLYYLVMALLTAWIDTSDLPEVHHQNAHAFIGHPDQVRNKNLIIHQPEREAFPWHGTVLAVYIIRLASIGLGVGTVLLAAWLGRMLFTPQIGLFAAALTGFNPMFLFVSAAVNNDSLAILLGHLGLVMLVRLWQKPLSPRSHWRHYAALGIVLGLGILTKLSLAGLLGLTGLALTCLSWRRREWRLLLVGGVMVVILALVVSGWWFGRNLDIYGDPTGLNAFIEVQGTRDQAITWQDWVGEFGTFFRTFWGLFGAVNVAAPEPFYWVCNLAAVVGAIGFLVWLRRKQPPARGGLWLPMAWVLIMFLLLIRWNIISSAFQGRLIFPALGALNMLWAVGMSAWVGKSQQPRPALLLSGWILGAAILLPWAVIRPAYAYPQPLEMAPAPAHFGPITFQAGDGEIQLVGVQMETGQSVEPAGEPVEVTLYWQVTHTVEQDYVSTVHLLGRDHLSVGQVNRHPGWGMTPTSRWETGQVWRDLYHIYVGSDAVAPARLQVSVGLYDTRAASSLPAFGPDGSPMEMVIVGQARLGKARSEPPEPGELLDVPLADGIALAGYDLAPQPAAPGEPMTLTLYWHATASPSQDYTVFVHLLDRDNAQLAGADGPPLAGDYPTAMWQAGDWVQDTHVIFVPPNLATGGYEVALGLYSPETGLRLPRLDGAGDSIILPVMVEAQ